MVLSKELAQSSISDLYERNSRSVSSTNPRMQSCRIWVRLSIVNRATFFFLNTFFRYHFECNTHFIKKKNYEISLQYIIFHDILKMIKGQGGWGRNWDSLLKDYSSGEEDDANDVLNIQSLKKNTHRVVELMQHVVPHLRPDNFDASPGKGV